MKSSLGENIQDLLRPLKIGEIVEGKVVGSGRSSLYIDLGRYGTGIVLGKEFYYAREEIKNLKKGDTVFIKVIDLKNEDGYVEVSLRAAGREIAWGKLRKMKEGKTPLTVKVLGANKGGLLSEVEGIQAFLPTSQLSKEHYPLVENADPAQIVRELQKLIGQELEVHILDLDPGKEKLILSEKIKESERVQELLGAFQIGEVVNGEVTAITDFGAFVKFAAKDPHAAEVEGLIHISELDWDLVEKPQEILQVGQKVQAKIIKLEGDRALLSLKAMKPDPWEKIEGKYQVGESVRGQVLKFGPFGALVRIAPGIYGLCHISEFGTRRKMQESLELEKEYDFTILQFEPKEHKMVLAPAQKSYEKQVNALDIERILEEGA
jgi:small subunit ribosomal protein S1